MAGGQKVHSLHWLLKQRDLSKHRKIVFLASFVFISLKILFIYFLYYVVRLLEIRVHSCAEEMLSKEALSESLARESNRRGHTPCSRQAGPFSAYDDRKHSCYRSHHSWCFIRILSSVSSLNDQDRIESRSLLSVVLYKLTAHSLYAYRRGWRGGRSD